jgi:hypothetical protein
MEIPPTLTMFTTLDPMQILSGLHTTLLSAEPRTLLKGILSYMQAFKKLTERTKAATLLTFVPGTAVIQDGTLLAESFIQILVGENVPHVECEIAGTHDCR